MKVLGLILCCGGIVLVSTGIWNAQTISPVEKSARRYLDALKDGNSAALVAELSPEVQHEITTNSVPVFSNLRPDPRLQYSIITVTQKAGETQARVVAEITKDGYRIRPILHFEKRDERWCLVGTSNLKRDPRWELRRLKREQINKQSLENDLRYRFKDVAGTSVETLK